MKVLSCTFLPNILCSFRRHEKVRVMSRCFRCEHYLRFCREMEEEEDEFFERVEAIRRKECCCVCGSKLGSDNRSDVWNVCGRCKKTLEM